MDQAQKVLPNDFRFYLLQGLALSRMEKQEDAVETIRESVRAEFKRYQHPQHTRFNIGWITSLSTKR